MVESSSWNIISSIGQILVGLAALITSYWLAFRSPQANLAKREKEEIVRKEREDHYSRLDQKIFRPLSSLVVKTPERRIIDSAPFSKMKLNISLELKSIKNSLFYEDAFKHLEEDYPDFEKDMKELEKGVNKLNDSVDNFKHNLEEEMSKEFPGEITITEKGPSEESFVYLPNVLQLLDVELMGILHKHYESGIPLKQIISDFKPIEEEFERKKESNQNIRYGGWMLMGNISEDKENQIITTINRLIKGEYNFLNRLIELQKEKDTLKEKSENISRRFEKISHQIDAKKYNTVVSCCPR